MGLRKKRDRMFGFGKREKSIRPVPPPEDIRVRESPSIWAVNLGTVTRFPGHLPEGEFFYQAIAIRDGVESPPQIAHARTHVNGSAMALTITKGGDFREPPPDKYRILRENKVIAEVAASQELFTDYLDVGEDLRNESDNG